jgi:hypothetical protein
LKLSGLIYRGPGLSIAKTFSLAVFEVSSEAAHVFEPKAQKTKYVTRTSISSDLSIGIGNPGGRDRSRATALMDQQSTFSVLLLTKFE